MGFQQTLGALSSPIRREILTLLKGGSMTVGDILAHFDTTGATLSHHLTVLRDAELVRSDRDGKNIYYTLNLSVMEELLTWVGQFKEDNHDA